MPRSISGFAILVLGGGLCGTMFAYAGGGAPQQAAASSASKATVSPTDYVGAETCTACHEAEAKGFGDNPHAKLALEHGGKGVTCESCHGPGQAHVESGGDGSKIFNSRRRRLSRWIRSACLAMLASTPTSNEPLTAKPSLVVRAATASTS